MIKLAEIRNMGRVLILNEEGIAFIKDHVEFERIIKKYDIYIDENDLENWDETYQLLTGLLKSKFCSNGKTTSELIEKYIMEEYKGIDPEDLQSDFKRLVKYFS